MRFMLLLGAFLLASCCALAQPSSSSPLAPPANGPRRADPAWIAFTDCTIHVKPGEVLERATLIMRDGKIMAILPAASAPGPDGKPALTPARTPLGPRIIDSRGLHIYPAFIDPYVELDIPAPRAEDSQLHWNPKVAPQRSALDGGGIDEPTAAALRKIGIATAALSHRSGIFRGRSAVVSLAKPADDASAKKPMVYRDNVYQAVAFETGGGAPNSQMGAIALARQTFLDAQYQFNGRKDGSFNDPINVLDYLAPTDASAGTPKDARNILPPRPATYLFITSDELDLFRTSKVAKEFKLPYMLMGSGLEFRRLAGAVDPKVPLLLPINFPKAPDVSSVGKQEAVELRDLMTWEQAPTNPRRLHAAGVDFAFTTARLRDRNEYLKNIRIAIKHGLPKEVALAALTTRPAQLLGVDDILGTIEAGKHANLLLVDGDLFDKTPDNKESKLRGVWIENTYHEITQAPVSFEGTWDVSIPADPRPIVRSFEIDRDNAVTVRRDGKEVKGTKVEAAPGRLTFVFDHDALDNEEGQCAMAAVVANATDGTPGTMTGIGVTGTGRRFDWVATRRPRALAGLWPIIFDNPQGNPGPVVIFDKDNIATIYAGDSGESPQADAPVPAISNFAYANNLFSYEVNQEAIKPGADVMNVSANVDWMAMKAPRLKGAVKPKGDANAQGFTFTSARRADNPFIGEWRVIEADGVAKDAAGPDGLTLKITNDAVTLTFTKAQGEPTIIKADDVAFNFLPKKTKPDAKADAKPEPKPEPKPENKPETEDGETPAEPNPEPKPEAQPENKPETKPESKPETPKPSHKFVAESLALTFTHDLAKLGMEGKSTDRITIEFSSEGADKDRLKGVGTMPDGSKHTYTLAKIIKDPSEDDAESIKEIPEKLPSPFGPYGRETYPEPLANLIISNATIWTSGPQGRIDNGFIYVKNGKIAMIGQGEPSIAVPQDERSRYINAKGKHVTPGIIDCHSHTGISGGVNEGGQAITAEVRIQDVTNPDAIGWYQQLAGGVTLVNNLHGSANAIGGQSQTNKLRWGAPAPDDMHMEDAMPGIKFALGENPRQINFRGGGGGAESRYPTTRMGVEMLIRDRFIAAREYLAKVKAGLNPRPDLELQAIGEILEGKRLVHAHSYRQDEMLMLALVAKEFGFKIGSYQHALEGYKVADYVRDNSYGASGFSDWWAYKVEVQDAIPDAFPIMHEQGVNVSFNSDSNELARRLNLECAKAVKYSNVDEVEAFKFVTINPAKQLKIEDRTGSLEEGKDGDVVLWSGSPLSVYSKVEATFVDGRPLFSLEEDANLREQTKTQRLRLIQKILNDGKKKKKDDATPGASPAEGSPADAPAGPGEGRRRRPRPPTEEINMPSQYLQLDEAQQEAVKQYFLDLYNRGGFEHQQGICGCGVLFW